MKRVKFYDVNDEDSVEVTGCDGEFIEIKTEQPNYWQIITLDKETAIQFLDELKNEIDKLA